MNEANVFQCGINCGRTFSCTIKTPLSSKHGNLSPIKLKEACDPLAKVEAKAKTAMGSYFPK